MYEFPDDRDASSAFGLLDALWAERIRLNDATQNPAHPEEPAPRRRDETPERGQA
ncbi:MAG: hypothetical protein ACLPSH_05805 [Vulcanimicrobiaceae bacterium]